MGKLDPRSVMNGAVARSLVCGLAAVATSLLAGAGCSTSATKSAHGDDVGSSASGISADTVVRGYAGKCLDVNGGGADDGTKVQLWECNGTSAQAWSYDGGQLVAPSGKCLDVQWGNPERGTPVQLWECNGTDAQQWRFDDGRLVGLGGKCLDVSGGASDDGTQVQIWDCNGMDWQRWSLEAKSTGGGTTTAPPATGSGDTPPNGGLVWHETFDTGRGIFENVWGDGVDFGTPGQVTLHRTDGDKDSGMMVFARGADNCWGYGVYTFTLSMGPGDAPGPYALLWPATDKWPGPELDMIEVLAGGGAYSTVHWDDSGKNGYRGYGLDGLDVTKVHTYGMRWEPGRLTGYVDGKEMWTTTDHVPADYAHGGENECPGVGMQTWWSADAQHGDNWITIYDATYSRL